MDPSDDNQPPPDNPDFLTVAQATAFLGIQTQTLREVILRGRIPVVRTYGRVLIARSDVEAYQARSQPEGKPQRGRPKQTERPEKQE